MRTTTIPAVIKAGSGPEGVRLGKVRMPQARPGSVVVEVEATGICGTDLHIAHDEYGYEAPVVMGHEILGRVVEVGADLDEYRIGRRVVCETYFSTCESCPACRDGRRNLCTSRRSIGSYENGGFAPYVEVPVKNLHDVPDELEGLGPVLAEPLACVAQCLLDPPVIAAADRVLVVGPGTMGQLSAQVALSQGAEVTLAGLASDRGRLDVAGRLGIATTDEPAAADHFDVVIEASGSAGGAAAALHAARRGGRYVQVGIFGAEVSIPMDLVLYKELTVTSGFASTPASWRRAMALMSTGSVTLAPMVTGQVALEGIHDAFRAVARGEGIKTVVRPGTSDSV